MTSTQRSLHISLAQEIRLDFPSDDVLHYDASQRGYILVRLYRPEEPISEPISVGKSFSVLISQLDAFIQIVGVASQVSGFRLTHDKLIFEKCRYIHL